MKYATYMVQQGRIEGDDPRDFLTWRMGEGHTVEITEIQVGSMRRKGIGRGLIKLLIRDQLPPGTVTLYAITRASNFIAQHFYEGIGWRVIGVLRRFYRDLNVKDSKSTVDAIMYGIDTHT